MTVRNMIADSFENIQIDAGSAAQLIDTGEDSIEQLNRFYARIEATLLDLKKLLSEYTKESFQ